MNNHTTESQTTEQHQTQQPAVEEIPALWLDERDEPFFRLTASVFSADFTFGAGVLLASYDDEFEGGE